MVDTYFDITPYLSAIDNGELIITANNRLRNHMLRAHGQRQTDATRVWPSPRIYSLSQWIAQQWQVLQRRAYAPSAQRIINNVQRQVLWEKIIGESSLAAALLQPEPLAQAADSALRNFELWQLTEAQVRAAEPLLSPQSNTYCWLTWLGEFRARLAQLGFITQESANQIVVEAFKTLQLRVENVIHVCGFDDIPPQHQDLLNSACHHLNSIKLDGQYTRLIRTEAANSEAEMRAAALWCKVQLEQTPAAMIGVIVPNLGQCRDQVERIFVEVFEPLAALPDRPRYTLPFNFSAGTPLGSTPIITATLDLLELQKTSWDLEAICHLLLSPFFSDADNEMVLRTHLIQTLRKLGKFTIRLSDLRYHCQQLRNKLGIAEQGSQLTTRLVHLENFRRDTRGYHSAQYWCDFFQQHLQILGWPGTRRLDSQEYQQITLWNQVLESFIQLDGTGIQFNYSSAIQQLRGIAGKMPFQAQTPNSPIQILGALEGAGLQFSHCWVMGLHHRQWPPVPAPNPLLPGSLQRAQKMPHASAERELQFARALTDHYRQCAPVVVFSSAHNDNDSEVSPSALIRHLPLTAVDELMSRGENISVQNYQLLAAGSDLEVVPTAIAPQLIVGQEPVRGGANLFKEQAACPFNAFARLRLGAVTIEEPVAGFSAIERGNLLHDALAAIWRELNNQRALLSLDELSLTSLIDQTTRSVVDALKQRRGTSIGVFYADLERERLARLIAAWLAQEKQRPAFTVVAIEEDVQIEFAGLPLRLRIDRIDQLDTGDLLLIDYKTGQPKLQSWHGDRMDEPQLPLYAVTASNPVAAIAFAQINAKAMKWIGTGELTTDHEGILRSKQPWQQQLQEWKLHLHQLATDFIQGDVRVDLKNITAAQYAEDLLSLNRLPENEALERFIHRMQGAV